MKKFMFYVMAVLSLFALVACGGKKGETKQAGETTQTKIVPEEGAKLIVWEALLGNEEYQKFVAQKFEEKYGVPVEFEGAEMTESITRLAQDGPAGTGADVIMFPHDRLGEALSAGLIMENLISADRIRNDFMDAASIAATANGKIMAWPIAIETYALYYNKDVLAKVPGTFEELIEFGKGFTDKRQNKYGIFWDIPNGYFAHAFLAMDGGYVFGSNGSDAKDIGLNTDGAVRGIENMVKLKEISVSNSGDAGYATMMGLFQEGKAATMINGPWAIGDLNKAGVNFGVAPFPSFDGKNLKPFSGVKLAGVSTYSKYPRAAQLFADFMTSEEMLFERYKKSEIIPPHRNLLNNSEILGNPNVGPFLQQAQFAIPMPAIAEIKYFWSPFGAALAESWDGKVSPKVALDTAKKTMEEAISLNK